MTEATPSGNIPPAYDRERIERLLADMERELAAMPADAPHVAALRQDIAGVRQALSQAAQDRAPVGERLHGVRNTLQTVSQRVEGEILKDSPYLTEIGRILGLV